MAFRQTGPRLPCCTAIGDCLGISSGVSFTWLAPARFIVESGTLTGRTIGHYAILEPLGEGGMGVVYKARDERLGRVAALKVMRPDRTGDADRRQRFIREARTASALNHPHILTIYEIDVDGDVDYLAMEYVAGGTLADLLASGPLPTERALRLTVQIADALAAAHGAGIVHRDLKPSNIMMAAEDRAKVGDFGLAKIAVSSLPAQETVDAVTPAGGRSAATPPRASWRPSSGTCRRR